LNNDKLFTGWVQKIKRSISYNFIQTGKVHIVHWKIEKNFLYILALFSLIIFNTGCIGKDNSALSRTEISDSRVIQHITNWENVFYGIVTHGGKEYYPINLPESFRQNGIIMDFSGELRYNASTDVKWGIPIELVTITRV
jgi:hypothetical protein